MSEIQQLVAAAASELMAAGQWLATAESCTGGLISAELTEVAGASRWFAYGFVTYGNQAKQELLGVAGDSLAGHGAVSEAVVREMALGARQRAGADWSIAVSGVAGPGGGSPDKPVGTVWIALAMPDGACLAVCHQFCGDRQSVRQQTVVAALSLLLQHLQQQSSVA